MTTTSPPPPRRLATHCSLPHDPPIPTQKDWLVIRLAFANTINYSVTSLDDLSQDGFLIPHEIKYDPVRGRGVYATEPIPKGTRISTSEQVAYFHSKDQFVYFLQQLPSDQLKCDILLWAYPTEGEVVALDMDPNSLVNHAETKQELNLGNDGRVARDIAAGETILMNYTEFIEYNSVDWFDQMRNIMWNPNNGKTKDPLSSYHNTKEYNLIGAPPDMSFRASTQSRVKSSSPRHTLAVSWPVRIDMISGCIAIRMKFKVYCMYAFYAVIVYAFCAHWVFAETGWLRQWGMHDFAGGGPVHLLGGVNGLVAILFVGPRMGRFDGSRPQSDFEPSSPTNILFGLFMLWWGWIGFNCGSTLGITDEKWLVATRAAATTINSTAGGGVAALLYSEIRSKGELVSAPDVSSGILASLVAIVSDAGPRNNKNKARLVRVISRVVEVIAAVAQIEPIREKTMASIGLLT